MPLVSDNGARCDFSLNEAPPSAFSTRRLSGSWTRVEAHFRRYDAGSDELNGALWNACHCNQHFVAEYLVSRGADVNWIGWGNQTPLDVAVQSEAHTLSEWLRDKGAKTAGELS